MTLLYGEPFPNAYTLTVSSGEIPQYVLVLNIVVVPYVSVPKKTLSSKYLFEYIFCCYIYWHYGMDNTDVVHWKSMWFSGIFYTQIEIHGRYHAWGRQKV